jgi:hypothetical protein
MEKGRKIMRVIRRFGEAWWLRNCLMLACLGGAAFVCVGCSRDESAGRIVAEEPQPENQMARTREQEVAHLITMLSSPDDGKVRRALYWLNEYAEDSESALPALETVAKSHSNEMLKEMAVDVIDSIQTAMEE